MPRRRSTVALNDQGDDGTQGRRTRSSVAKIEDRADGDEEVSESDHSEPKSASGSPRKRKSLYEQLDDLELDGDEPSNCQAPSIAPNYFLSHASRAKTSSKTLQEADLQVLQDSHKSGPVNYLESEELRHELYKRYEQKLLPETFFLLYERTNVILYGFGSKRTLLDKFCKIWLADEHHLVIYGFFPEMTNKHVLSYFKEILRAEDSSLESLYAAAEELNHDLYVVIHSIDVLLSSSCPKLKPILIELMNRAEGRMRLLASVDHVHSGLLFNTKETNELHLVWMNCSTMESYAIERGYSSNLDTNASSLLGHLTLSSIEHVCDSLNPNAQKIFIQILRHFLSTDELPDEEPVKSKSRPEASDTENDSNVESESDSDRDTHTKRRPTRSRSEAQGLPFSSLYRICREEYLVNSEITLKAQLTEFKDHKLIKFNKRSDGTQIITLLISKALAQKFLDKIED